ncbi:MAG: M42 family metallopeptidase [Sulfolobales archaeon]
MGRGGLDKEEIFSLLRAITGYISPSGFEDDLRGYVKDLFLSVADGVQIDSMGNVIAFKKGSRGGGRIMLAAHMDEIGLFISHIDDKGFLRALPIGGVFERALIYQRVLIRTRDGRIYRGVIGLKPPHIAKPEEARQVPELRELFIDVGASSRSEVEKMGIRVGDVAVYDRELVRLSSDRVSGKALDDRVGLAALIKTFELVEDNQADIYAVATVQEEVGLKGARTAAYSISPDAALAIDVTIASDYPGVPEHEWYSQLGKGPAIKIADGRGATGLIANQEIINKLISIATELGIPYQVEVAAGGTTDASAIQLNKEGTPSGVISIPARYIHSPVEVIDLNDVINTIKLAKGFCEKSEPEWLSKLKGLKIK